MYVLIALFEMTNYVTRLAVPYLVPFICLEHGFSEQQRALLLNSFTPGYLKLVFLRSPKPCATTGLHTVSFQRGRA